MNDQPSTILASLRALLPRRPLLLSEALRLAELQASRLLEIAGIDDAPVPDDLVTRLSPRITVEYDFDMPGLASGASDWDTRRRCWVITLNPTEPDTRLRFTTLHECKHIIDHGSPGLADPARRLPYVMPAGEFIADYFAGCVLMPKRLLRRAWASGVQHPSDLALAFDVSQRAVSVRLAQLGLSGPLPRCGGPPGRLSAGRSPFRRYHRALSINGSQFADVPMEVAS